MVAAFREGLNDVVYAEGRNVVSLGGRKLRSTDSTSGQTKALSLLIAIYRLRIRDRSHATLPKDTCERPTAWLGM